MLVEMHQFNRSRLLEQSVFAKFRGNKRRALPRVLGGNVVADCPALIQYEAIVILPPIQNFLILRA